MNQPTINKVAMLILMEHDLDAAIDFYSRLGIPLKFRMKETWAEFELQGIKLGLCQSNYGPQDNRTGIVLQVENLRDFYTAHKETIPFLTQPVEAAHGIMTSIKDPSGNIIDLYQATPEKLQEVIARNKEQADLAAQADACCKPAPEKCCKNEAPKTSCF